MADSPDPITAGVLRRLSRRIADLEQQIRDQGRASQASRRSVEDGGTFDQYDEDGNLRASMGPLEDGAYGVRTYGEDSPDTPSAPLVSRFAGGATITWDGFNDAGVQTWPSNFTRVTVHLKTVPGDPADLENQIGTFESRDGGSLSIAQPSDVTTYCTLVAWVDTGSSSLESTEVDVTGGEGLYTWLKYADDATGAGMSDDPTGKAYIGLAYNRTSSLESTNPADYEWTKTQGMPGDQGVPGPPGADGSSLFTWIKYADDGAGTGLTDDPTGKAYIGLAYNQTTQTEGTDPAAYTWSLIKGDQGNQGIPGPPGADGSSLFTWLKYADTPTTGMSDSPTGKTYMGIAYNKASATESTNYADYSWSLIKGDPGAAGADGVGITGTTVTYQVGASGTTAPTGTWTTTVPSVPAGQYLWTKTVTSYSSGTPTTAYAVAYAGTNGTNGTNGRGISSTAVTYQVGSSGTTAPTGTWQSAPQTTTAGQFLWTRTVTTYTDNTTSTSYSVAAHGDTGQQGVPGPPGADGAPTYTWIKYATDSTGSSMSDDPTGRPYIGFAYNKLTQTESTVPSDYTWSLIQGAQGNQGVPGPAGADGVTTYTWIKYGTSSAGANLSDSPTGATYMGIAANKTTATESTNPADYTWSLIQGPKGDTGAPPPEVAPTAPAVTTTGMPRGFMLRVTNPAPGWSYVWHVVDTSTGGYVGDYPATKNPVFYSESLPNGSPFTSTSDGYTFHVTASNSAGSATSSDYGPLGLVLNDSSTIASIAVDKLIAGDLTGAFALLGSLQVGASIKVSDAGGIVISQPNGGSIVFPADGSAANISSHLDAFSLSVRDRLSIKGTLNEISTGAVVALASGTSAPASPPSVTDYWPSVSFRAAPGFDKYNRGLVPHPTDSNAWYTVNATFNGSIRLCDDTGAGIGSWDLRSTAGLTPVGLTMIGTTIYVLCFDSTRNYRWFVRRYNAASSMAFLGEWEWTAGVLDNTPYDGQIGRTEDGNAVLLAVCEAATDRPRVYRYTPDTGALITVTNENGVAGSNYIRLAEVVAASLSSIWYGNADLTAAPAYVYSTDSSSVHAAGVDGARFGSDEWPAAASSALAGLAWSPLTSRWYSLDDTGTRYQYGTVKAPTVRSVTYSWYDADAGGTGVHETAQGQANSYTQKARALFKVQAGTPNDTGGTDDPNSVRIWINGNRQADLGFNGDGTPILVATYNAPTTGTTSKAADFPAAATPGELRGGGGLISLKGNGASRIGGVSSDTAGMSTADGAKTTGFIPVGAVIPYFGDDEPAGWFLVTGPNRRVSFTGASYPALRDKVGDKVQAHVGDTYYLPDLTARVPRGIGSAAGATPGSSYGADSVTLADANLPSHTHAIKRSSVSGTSGTTVVRGGTNDVGDANTLADGGGQSFSIIPSAVGHNYLMRAI